MVHERDQLVHRLAESLVGPQVAHRVTTSRIHQERVAVGGSARPSQAGGGCAER